jgi:CRP/FNR family cyclic AMP-dependent transcriptional regulator
MMTEETLTKTVAEQSFFSGLRDDQIAQLVAVATEIEVPASKAIFEEGGHADSAYIIIEGRVALELDVSHRAHHIVQTLHEGEVLGWGWLFPPYRWSFSALALEKVRLIRFDAEQLRATHEADCELGYEMMKRFARVMTSRLAATRLQLVDFYGNSR